MRCMSSISLQLQENCVITVYMRICGARQLYSACKQVVRELCDHCMNCKRIYFMMLVLINLFAKVCSDFTGKVKNILRWTFWKCENIFMQVFMKLQEDCVITMQLEFRGVSKCVCNCNRVVWITRCTSKWMSTTSLQLYTGCISWYEHCMITVCMRNVNGVAIATTLQYICKRIV